MKRLLPLLVVAAALGGCAAKPEPAPTPSTPKTVVDTELVCAIDGMKIAEKSKSAGVSVYEGKRYFFCCPGCKVEFDREPATYAAKFPPKKK